MPSWTSPSVSFRLPVALLSLSLMCGACQSPPEDASSVTASSDTHEGSTQTHTSDSSGSETSTTSEGSSATASAETSDTSTSESGELPDISVQWIEVAASDYKLELEPEFDSEITSYSALADGPDIAVYVDVIINADVEGVLVNDVPAQPYGFRTWRSLDSEVISPGSITIEVLADPVELPLYTIDVTIP